MTEPSLSVWSFRMNNKIILVVDNQVENTNLINYKLKKYYKQLKKYLKIQITKEKVVKLIS